MAGSGLERGRASERADGRAEFASAAEAEMREVGESVKELSESVRQQVAGGAMDGETGVRDEPNALEDTQLRYAAYASRFAQIFKTKMRLFAYSSDVGESARPVVSPAAVRALYGITFGYVATDVAIEGHMSWKRGDASRDIARSMFGTLIFQSIASVLVPSVIIHTAVAQTQKMINKNVQSTFARRFVPVGVGLALIPALPFVDHPIEYALDKTLDAVWPRAAEAAVSAAAEAKAAAIDTVSSAVSPSHDKKKTE